VNRQMMHSKALDADDLAPLDETEYEESDDVETAVELGLLLAQMQPTRFAGV
jgi:hypothetical protein